MATSTEAARLLLALREGELTLEGRLVEASNASFVGVARLPGAGGAPSTARGGGLEVRCVYKPIAGEAPLWDFPDGTLAHREVAAFLVSEAAGWDVVPPTAFRERGPLGPGMAQQWIDVDREMDLLEALRAGHAGLRRIALFDAVVNNTDRKGGHLLPAPDGRLLGVDHGVCFAVEPKLRTILWGWRGSALDAGETATLERLRAALEGRLGRQLRRHLAADETVALRQRVAALLSVGRFPHPSPDWPAVPWPPF
jgi:hypothetical protein